MEQFASPLVYDGRGNASAWHKVGGPAAEPETLLTLSELWQELVRGQACILEQNWSKEACRVTIRRRAQAARPASEASVGMLARVLTGESQKSVAIDAQLAQSTVAVKCSSLLREMAVVGRPSRAPLFLMMAAHAMKGVRLPALPARRLATTEGCWSLSYRRPTGGSLRRLLTPCENLVVQCLLEGHTHAQIAAVRSTSVRTVANQLASVFRKFGVSGRAAFFAKLLEHDGPNLFTDPAVS